MSYRPFPQARIGDGVCFALMSAYLFEYVGAPWGIFWSCIGIGFGVNLLQALWRNR